MKKRVVLIDGDAHFSGVVRYLIGAIEQLVVVNTYDDCASAWRSIDRDSPDVVIMDGESRSLSSTEFLVKIRKKNPAIEALILTDYFDPETILSLIASGATGVLLKQNCLNRLDAHLRELIRGGSPLDPAVARVLIRAHSSNDLSPLTIKETIVLKLMTNGMTYTMIAEELGISKETSKTHIKNIYRKLNVSSRAEAVSKAITSKLISTSAAVTDFNTQR